MATDSQKTASAPKEATRVVELTDIKFKEENALLAAASCIPLVGAIVFFIEKDDLFVRYYAAQFGVLFVLGLALGIIMPILAVIPVINIIVGLVAVCLTPLLGLGTFILMIVAGMKAYKGERFDIPVLSGLALKVMNKM